VNIDNFSYFSSILIEPDVIQSDVLGLPL
jgi:hypothetical protein